MTRQHAPENLAGVRVVERHARRAEGDRLAFALVDAEDLEAGSRRDHVADVHRVAVPQPGREQSRAVVVHDHRAVDDLVLAVGIDVGNREIVIALARERRGGRIGKWSHADARVEDPARGQLPVPPVPRRQHRAAVVAARHHDAWQAPVEVGDGGQHPIAAVAVVVVVAVAADPAPTAERIAAGQVLRCRQGGAGRAVEDGEVFGSREDLAVACVVGRRHLNAIGRHDQRAVVLRRVADRPCRRHRPCRQRSCTPVPRGRRRRGRRP